MTYSSLPGQQRLAEKKQTDTLLVKRPVKINDGAGGATIAAPPTVATTTCRTEEPTAHELEAAGATLGVTMINVWCPVATDVRMIDLLVIGNRTFSVVGVDTPLTGEVERKVLAKETV